MCVTTGACPIIRGKTKREKNVHVVYPITVDVGVKLPKSVSNFLSFWDFLLIMPSAGQLNWLNATKSPTGTP